MMNDIKKLEKKVPVIESPKLVVKRVLFFPRWFLLLLLISIVANLYFIFWGRSSRSDLVKTEVDNRKLIAEVSKLLALPEDETPSIATISDPAKLIDQPFFAKAKLGDRVLIYTNNRKAILYRPTEKRLIEVVELSLNIPQ